MYNGVPADSPFALDAVVTMSAFDREGEYLGESEPFLELPPGGLAKIDVDEILRGMAHGSAELRDVMGIVHLTPREHLGKPFCEVTKGELMTHSTATDDFVEYYSYDGNVVTGVAYQTGQINDPRMSSTRTTTVQAPKVIVSDRVDTIFLLMNLSTSLDYDSPVTLRFVVMDPQGQEIVRSSITVPAFTFRLLSMRDVLQESGRLDELHERGGCGTLFGYAADGSLVPLSMTRNDATGAIAVDHTLPPPYYVSKWGGPLRKRGNAQLDEALFARTPAGAVS